MATATHSRNIFAVEILNFTAELYASQTKMPFYILTSNPQIIHRNMNNWKITRFGHASKGKDNTRINNELRGNWLFHRCFLFSTILV
jgi:hypothetical protein